MEGQMRISEALISGGQYKNSKVQNWTFFEIHS